MGFSVLIVISNNSLKCGENSMEIRSITVAETEEVFGGWTKVQGNYSENV